jgi:diguanylate cyclase (GGDEF)-like protein/PAS domain S-box-containing protein
MSDFQDNKSSGKAFFEEITEWQQTFDAIPDIIIVIDNHHKIVMANRSLTLKLGIDSEALLGKPCYEIIHNLDKAPGYCPCIQSDSTETEQIAEAYEKHLDCHYTFTATPLFNSSGDRIGTVDVIRDISVRKLTQEALLDSENIFRAITESATDAIVSIDKEDNIVLWNQTAEKMFGYTAEEAVGNKVTILMPEKYRAAHKKGISRYVSTGKSKVVGKNHEVTARRKDGKEFPVELSLSSWERKDDIFFTAIIRDITRRRKLEQKLLEASLTDELTGLLNRRGFITLSEKQMQVSKRYKRRFSILFLDLNEMKQINDNFGHKKGDQALTDLADLLKKSFRSSDIIARIGGDEFTVLINEPDTDIDKTITNNFMNSLQTFNDQSDRPYQLSISMGISHFDPSNPQSIDDLLAEADKLMYEHKSHKLDELSPEPDGKDNRKSERVNTGNDYVAELIVSDSSMIRNISSNGICVVTPYMLKKDNIYSVKIHSDNAKVFSLSAVVVWSASMRKGMVNSADRYETGLMFIDLDKERKSVLNQFIKNLSLDPSTPFLEL